MVQFREPGVTADAGLLAFRLDIEILPLFADRRMDLLAEGDAVERVDHGIPIPLDDASDLRAPSLMRAKPPGRFEIGGHNRRIAIMELGEAGLGIGVDDDLPKTRPTPFSVPSGMCPARRKAPDIRVRARLVPLFRPSEL
jgi:hypothetical protein